MKLFDRKLHREIEKAFKLKKNSCEKAVSDLKEKHKKTQDEILDIVKECVEYCKFHNQDSSLGFLVAFNLYVSCLNSPNGIIKKEEVK